MKDMNGFMDVQVRGGDAVEVVVVVAVVEVAGAVVSSVMC